MTLPRKVTIATAAAWRDACLAAVPDLDPVRMLVVHTPSAGRYVDENFGWAEGRRRLVIENEPSAQDFAGLEALPAAPQLVLGIGGGKALDAAKAAAYWRTAYASAAELGTVLASGGKIATARAAGLMLAPSIASSGSEASKAAIVAVDGRKTGLRGAGLTADAVVHDPRLWTSLTEPVALHYAFDIFAHLVETTVSLRRTDESLGHAREGFARLGHWLFRHNASLASYQEAMDASFAAGACLATSSTCLPHRIQYVIGPVTGTSHVEGIWHLAPSWFSLVERLRPDRVADAASMLPPGASSAAGFRGVFDRIHAQAGAIVRRERFAPLAGAGVRLAGQVNGDVEADPVYAGRSTLEGLIG